MDSGAADNYIAKSVAQQAGLELRRKQFPYYATTADGTRVPITQEVYTEIPLSPGDKTKKTRLNVLGTAAHDVILGMPWLRDHNPRIDWKERKISIEDTKSTRASKPAHRQRSMADEKSIANVNATSTKMDGKTNRIASTDAKVYGYSVGEEEKSVLLKILDRYLKKFIRIFVERKGLRALPEHRS